MARLYNVTAHQQFPLQDNWEFLSTASGHYQNPEQLENGEHIWSVALVPGTVIGALEKNRQWDLTHPLDVDAMDWWYRGSFEASLPERGKQVVLKFSGLATVTEIWLNGRSILSTDNMFRAYEVDITEDLHEQNILIIHFFSLQALLSKKRPRPRWRTQLVEQQQLRWFRTTLLGHMPGWSPPMQAIGPWGSIVLEERSILAIERLSIQTRVQRDDGYVAVRLHICRIAEHTPTQAMFVIDDRTFALDVLPEEDGLFVLSGDISVPHVRRWWPHTHGSQPLYPAKIVVQYPATYVELDCGRLAFRHIELLDVQEEGFGLRVNGTPIFCRGACWTPLNMVRLVGSYQEYAQSLQMAQRAGLNMLRVSGTMIYEDDLFYDLCDEAGMLVWQDFMFANMDYPTTETAFAANCVRECEQLLERLQAHACLAVLCGNSEVQQQVAMLGLTQEVWHSEFFEHVLREICQAAVDIPYWISSPGGGTEGTLPFQVNVGNAHYYGVGAYLRPLEDARRSDVRFASECLAFAHIPEDRTLDLFLKPGEQVVHHPKWKERVPRDAGSAWDFEDVRDHYLQLLFAVDPLKLRYSDMQRYLALSRVATGEVVGSVFAEWRRRRSHCHGGLIWFYRDLWPGAGWGILDSTGHPKAVYYYLRRVSLPQACFFADEGLNGLWLHVINDRGKNFSTEVQVSLYRYTGVCVETVTQAITVFAHDAIELHVDALFGHFLDLTYAYRFGPAGYDFAVATLPGEQRPLSEAFYFPCGLPSTRAVDLGLHADATKQADGNYQLTLRTEKFAQSVAIQVDNFLAEDNYFHMQPRSERVITLFPGEKESTLRGFISALNTYHEIAIHV